MDISTYQERRRADRRREPVYRRLCHTCLQPDFSCYCGWLAPFDPQMQFVILIHPLEYRRRIATGRMAHLSLKNSRLILGYEFTANTEVNQILREAGREIVILYPGKQSRNLSLMSPEARRQWTPPGRKLTVFVVDGSWSTARKMVERSENLRTLPRMCFTPTSPSNFRVRRQPHPECYSTIEAIHQTIELLGDACGFATAARTHDRLLQVFENMVNRQIHLAHCGKPMP